MLLVATGHLAASQTALETCHFVMHRIARDFLI